MADPIIGKISVGDGATFIPTVSEQGVISWSNNKNLPNPASVDIPQVVMDRYQVAPVNSPAFTGNPTAPTQAKTDNSTKLATTAYVKAVVADYLALTGGSITGDVDITGDLSVSGMITGNVSGNADTATNATNDANGDEISTTYLPLAGGTMTGEIGYENGNSQTFGIGFSDANKDNVDIGWTFEDRTGAGIGLRSKDHTEAGGFDIWTDDGTNRKVLLGKPDGTLSWGGKNILTVDDIYYKAGDTFSFSDFAPATGFITSGRKEMYALVCLPKRIDNVNSITCNSIRGGIRTPAGGYVHQDNTDLKSLYNVGVSGLFGCNIRIQFSSTSEITSAVNNTPLAFVFNSMSLTFN